MRCRVRVPTMEAAEALREIKKQIHIPLVADIELIIVWRLRRSNTEQIRSDQCGECGDSSHCTGCCR